MPIQRHLLRAAIYTFLSLTSLPAVANDFRVNRYDDPPPNGCQPADCSLREAIRAANATIPKDRILLSAGTYVLSLAGQGEDQALSGDLDVRGSVEISGPGPSMTKIDANDLDRAFEVFSSDSLVKLRGVMVKNGPDGVSGSALQVSGDGTVVLEDCFLFGNEGTSAINVGAGASLIVRRSRIDVNDTAAIIMGEAHVQIESSTIGPNGGIATIQASAGAELTCVHCTLGDTINNTHELIRANGSATRVTLVNSILLGSCQLLSGAQIESLGGNMESPAATCGFGAADSGYTASQLRLAADNAHGMTTVFLPESDSPAVDRGVAASCLPFDQRGATRPEDCDIGAGEEGVEAPGRPIFVDAFEQGHAGAWLVSPPS